MMTLKHRGRGSPRHSIAAAAKAAAKILLDQINIQNKAINYSNPRVSIAAAAEAAAKSSLDQMLIQNKAINYLNPSARVSFAAAAEAAAKTLLLSTMAMAINLYFGIDIEISTTSPKYLYIFSCVHNTRDCSRSCFLFRPCPPNRRKSQKQM